MSYGALLFQWYNRYGCGGANPPQKIVEVKP